MFKKLLLILALSVPLFAQNITGSGTSGDPYILYDAADVDSIRYLGLDKYYKLGADIDMSAYTSWVPLGDGSTAFTGGFDGDNYSILHFSPTISTTTTSYLGLFGAVNTAGDFKNITIDSSNIKTSNGSWTDGAAFGILIGRIDAVDSVYNITIQNSSLAVYGQSEIGGRFNVGMMVGIGYSDLDIIAKCRVVNSQLIFKGTHTTYTAFAGLFIGYNRISTRKCYVSNSSIVVTESGSYVGGFAAYTNEPIQDCYVKDIVLYDSSASGAYKALFTAQHATIVDVEDYCYAVGQFGGSNTSYQYSFGYSTPAGSDFSSNFTDTTVSQVSTTMASAITNPPQGKTTAEMKVPGLYTGEGWDFTTIWGIDTLGVINDGYPYLIDYHEPAVFAFLSPTLGSSYAIGETVPIQFTVSNTDTVRLSYTDDGGSSWTNIDTMLVVTNDTMSYNWELLSGFSGLTTVTLRVDNYTDTTQYALSGAFSVLVNSSIEILYPIDGTSTKSLGDTLNVRIKTILVDSLSLWYAVDDTSMWIPIIYNLPVGNPNIDTTIYSWTLPNIHGEIWFKASQVADTTLYAFDQPVHYLGRNMASQPWICWFGPYDDYFGYDLNYPWYVTTPFAYSWYVDPTCGWASGVQYGLTMMVNPDATSIIEHRSGRRSYTEGPYLPDSTTLYLGGDTTVYKIPEIFNNYGSSVTYRQRTYYYDSTAKVIRCNDLRNNIDSIVVADLSGTIGGYVISGSTMVLQVYNVYWANIAGDTLLATTNLETLNPPLFSPKILLLTTTIGGRGRAVFAFDALAAPSIHDPVSDTVRLLTELTITRDYFRGIDPKARKKGR